MLTISYEGWNFKQPSHNWSAGKPPTLDSHSIMENLSANPTVWTEKVFSNFSCIFLNPNIFSNLNYNFSNLWDMRNLQEEVKKAFCYQKLFWPFTVWTNCSSYLKIFANSRPSASNFKSFSQSLEQFFSHSRLEQFW